LFLKKEAIEYSWEILTEVYKLPKDRLYMTYFEGDPKNGLAPDEEARQIWLDTGVAEDHILPGNAKDNFWGKCLSICLHVPHMNSDAEMGATGPCGPCR
jgi:alanyl-tRNA synthetase